MDCLMLIWLLNYNLDKEWKQTGQKKKYKDKKNVLGNYDSIVAIFEPDLAVW